MCACLVIIPWYMFMFYMLSINALCCDAVLYCMGSIMGTIAMGTIGISLYQHFMTARTSYVIGILHKVFVLRWYHTCYHVLPTVIWCYLNIIHAFHVIDLCSLLRCDTVLYGDHRYGNRRYGDHHMGTTDTGTIDIRRYQYNDMRRYIQLCVIACLGVGGVHMYHHSRQVRVGLRYCDTYQLRLCVRSVVAITLSCNCRTESW